MRLGVPLGLTLSAPALDDRPMSFVLTWSRDEYVELDELVNTLERVGKALSLDFAVRLEQGDAQDDDEDDPEPDEPDEGGSSVVVREPADIGNVELRIKGAVAIQVTFTFTGFGFELVLSPTSVEFELVYLFVLHAATSLGMVPQDLLDEESDYVDSVKRWIEACVEDELTRLEREGESEIEIEPRPGIVGPLVVERQGYATGPGLAIHGAGVDLHVRLTGCAASLSQDELLAVIEEVRDETLVSLVQEERTFRLATSEPLPAPEHGKQSVLRRWVDGVAQSPRLVDMAESIGDAQDHDVICDLVHYLSNGQPILRRTSRGLKRSVLVEKLWYTATWSWTPATTTEIERVFEAITRDARASFVPPPRVPPHSGLTLERWLAEVSRISGKLFGFTARELVKHDAASSRYLWNLQPRSPITIDDVEAILAAVEDLEGSDSTRDPNRLSVSGVWEDDSTDGFVETLVAMLGLPEAPIPSAPAPFDAYLGTLNAAAAAIGRAERLYVIPSMDETRVVMLVPSVFEALTQAGLLRAHLPEGPEPKRAGLWAYLKNVWARSAKKN